jgi:tetratricopeptide (TPR) repeat protein
MPRLIACPSCKRTLRVPDLTSGQLFQCPACRNQFREDAPAAAHPPTNQPVLVEPEPEPLPAPPIPDGIRSNPVASPGRPVVEREESLPARTGRPARNQARSGDWRTWVVTLLCALFVVGIVGAGVLLKTELDRRARQEAEPQGDPPQDRQAAQDPVDDQKPLGKEELERELNRAIEDVGEAIRLRDGQRFAARFNTERMFEEQVKTGIVPARFGNESWRYASQLSSSLQRSMITAKDGIFLGWKSFEIKQVKKMAGNDVAILVRHRDHDGDIQKMRWWLTRRGGWRVYDIDDLNLGVRFSAILSGTLPADVNRNLDIARCCQLLKAADGCIHQQDADGAERQLRAMFGTKLPATLDAGREVVRALVHYQRGEAKEMLDALGRAEKLHPDLPSINQLKGMANNHLGKWDVALKHLEAYRDLLGEDPELNRQLALSLRGVGRFPEACVIYRRLLDDNPRDAHAFGSLLLSLEVQEKRDDIGRRFARLDDAEDSFDGFAESCVKQLDYVALEELASTMRQLDDAHASTGYYLALVRVNTGRIKEAIPLYQSALIKEKDKNKHETYTLGFVQAMIRNTAALEAYRAVPDPRMAFRTLAPELKKGYRQDLLHRLICLHRKNQADDPLLPWYEGESYVWRAEYQLADRAFTAALASKPDAATRDLFRSSRVTARFQTDKAVSAYRDIDSTEETFVQLANMCLTEERLAQLPELLDAHAKNYPSSGSAQRFRYRLKIRQKQIEEGITLFQAALVKQTDKDQRRQLISEFLIDMQAAGKVLEGYQAVPDAKEAFAALLVLDEDYEDQPPKLTPELRQVVALHREKYPNDPRGPSQAALFLEREGKWKEAVTALREAWSKATPEFRQTMRWRLVHAMYKSGQGMKAYHELEPRKEIYDQLVNLLANDKKWAEIDTLVQTYRQQADGPDPQFHQTRVTLHLRGPAEARPWLENACKQQQDVNKRNQYITTFAYDALSVGKGMEGYRLAPDRTVAFKALASSYFYQKKEKELAELLGEYCKDHADDPLCRYYQGELHLMRGELELAEKEFAPGVALPASPHHWQNRQGLLRTRVKAGKTAATYQEQGPSSRNFLDLASMCVAEKAGGQLEELLAAHRQADPDDPDLPVWELEVKWLKGDHEGVLKLLTAPGDNELLLPRHRWKSDNYRIRCLVKLKRAKEALAEAEKAVKHRFGDQMLLVLAHASTGDCKQTIASVEKLTLSSWRLTGYYNDPDLGPILKSDAFKAFREKFPEPKGEVIEDD